MPKETKSTPSWVSAHVSDVDRFVQQWREQQASESAAIQSIMEFVKKYIELQNDTFLHEDFQTPNESKEDKDKRTADFVKRDEEIKSSLRKLESVLSKVSTAKTPSRKDKKGILFYVEKPIDDSLNQLSIRLSLSKEYLLHKALYMLFDDAKSVAIPIELERRLARPGINVGGRPKKKVATLGD